MPAIRTGSPGGERPEVIDVRDPLMGLGRKALPEAPQVEPFQIGLTEIIERMVEVEAVDDAADPLERRHRRRNGHSQNKKPLEP